MTAESERRKRRPRYWFDARKRFFVNNFGRAKALAADVAYLLSYGSYRIRRVIQRKPNHEPKWMFWDFFRYNFLAVKQ